MTGSLQSLVAATLVFVCGHFILSHRALRGPLVEFMGARAFMLFYSAVALISFAWMLLAYGAAPQVVLWDPPAVLRWVPLVVMPIALFLGVAGMTTPNPTLVGAEQLVIDLPEVPVKGIVTVTRHPFLWGVVLWSLSHLLVKGDLASITLFGGLLILAQLGMLHIDERREDTLGAQWGPFKMRTSLVPLAAVINGRSKLDGSGIGWWRPALALVVYLGLLHFHPALFGVSPLPF